MERGGVLMERRAEDGITQSRGWWLGQRRWHNAAQSRGWNNAEESRTWVDGGITKRRAGLMERRGEQRMA